jgi:hypothetical protein
MSYNLSHLQHTIHYIVEQLEYADHTLRSRKLSSSDKRWIEEELFVAVFPLSERNPKNIAINSTNTYLKDFLVSLHNSNIEFPAATTYLLKREGLSYELHDGSRKEIYNRQKLKNKVNARRSAELASLADKLNELAIDDSDEGVRNDCEITYTPHYCTLGDYLPSSSKPVSPIYTRHMNAKL